MSLRSIVRRGTVLMALTAITLTTAASVGGPALSAAPSHTVGTVPATGAATSLPEPCGEPSCTPVQAAYISHFTGLDCTGTESYYTPYFFYDGIRRSWNGTGNAGTILRTVTNRSYRNSSGTCFNQWPNPVWQGRVRHSSGFRSDR